MLSHEQVFENRHPGEEPNVLEGTGHARRSRYLEAGHSLQEKDRAIGRGAPLFSLEGDVGQSVKCRAASMYERDASLAGLVEPRNAVEDRGLARAVRADDGGDVAAPRREGEAVNSDEPAEAHGEILHAEDFVSFSGCAHAHELRPSLTKLKDMPRASCRKADGVRPARSPCRRQTMTSTMDKPKISMR